MFSHAMNRYTKNFGPLFLVGLVTTLITLVPTLVIGGIMGGAAAINYGPVIQQIVAGSMPDLGGLVGLVITVLTGAAVILIINAILGPIAFVGRVSAARDALQGQPIEIGKALKAGAAGWGRGVGYVLLMGITQGLAAFLLMVVAALPLALGVMGIFLSIPLLLVWFYLLFVMNAAFWYGMYAMVHNNLSVGDAFSQAWSGLFQRMGDRLAAGGVLLLITVVFGIVGAILGRIPYIGSLAVTAVSGVFIPLYFGARFTGASSEPVYGGAPTQAPGQQPPQP